MQVIPLIRSLLEPLFQMEAWISITLLGLTSLILLALIIKKAIHVRTFAKAKKQAVFELICQYESHANPRKAVRKPKPSRPGQPQTQVEPQLS